MWKRPGKLTGIFSCLQLNPRIKVRLPLPAEPFEQLNFLRPTEEKAGLPLPLQQQEAGDSMGVSLSLDISNSLEGSRSEAILGRGPLQALKNTIDL